MSASLGLTDHEPAAGRHAGEEQSGGQLYHVIDYVQLIGPDGGHDLSSDIQRLYDTRINAYYDDQWDTNIMNVGVPVATGLANQFAVSAGFTSIIQDPYWAQQDLASA